MAYIESHQALGDHPKVKRGAEMLGISEARMVGHLHYLWWWALDYAPDGSLAGLRDAEIARAARYPTGPIDKRQLAMWDAEPPKDQGEAFVRALVECSPRPGRPGFLERTDAGLVLHDWNDFTGAVADFREITRKKWRDQKQQRRNKLRLSSGMSGADNAECERDVSGGHSADSSADGAVDVSATSGADNAESPRVSYLVSSSHVSSDQDRTPPKSPAADTEAGVSLEEKMLRAAERTPRDGHFTDFRLTYPRNASGTEWSWGEARRVWEDVVPPGQETACLEKLRLYAASDEVQRGKIRQPANWLPGWRGQQKPRTLTPVSAKAASTVPNYVAIEREAVQARASA